MRTVPACANCNSTTKKDDEYFRLVIATVANDSNAAGDILRNKIFPGAAVRPGLLNKIIRTIQPIDIFSEAGIYIGDRKSVV